MATRRWFIEMPAADESDDIKLPFQAPHRSSIPLCGNTASICTIDRLGLQLSSNMLINGIWAPEIKSASCARHQQSKDFYFLTLLRLVSHIKPGPLLQISQTRWFRWHAVTWARGLVSVRRRPAFSHWDTATEHLCVRLTQRPAGRALSPPPPH